jgi:hypothetical protein
MKFLARAVILTNGWKRGLRFLLARWLDSRWHTRYFDDLAINRVIEKVRGAGGYLASTTLSAAGDIHAAAVARARPGNAPEDDERPVEGRAAAGGNYLRPLPHDARDPAGDLLAHDARRPCLDDRERARKAMERFFARPGAGTRKTSGTHGMP